MQADGVEKFSTDKSMYDEAEEVHVDISGAVRLTLFDTKTLGCTKCFGASESLLFGTTEFDQLAQTTGWRAISEGATVCINARQRS